jgi:hypothetical protein
MTSWKNSPLDLAIKRERERTDEIANRQPLISEDEFVTLAEHIRQPGPRDRFIQDFVAGALLSSGGETQTTPAPRCTPERAAGRQGAGDGQHLSLVGGRVIDAADRFNARRRNHFNNGSAA